MLLKEFKKNDRAQIINIITYLKTLNKIMRETWDVPQYIRQYLSCAKRLKTQGKLNRDIKFKLLLREISRNIRKKLLKKHIIDFKDISDENFKDITHKISKMARMENEIKNFLDQETNNTRVKTLIKQINLKPEINR